MVFWSKPNDDTMGDHRPMEQFDCLENIREMEKNKKLIASLKALEDTLKKSSGTLACIDGSVYKIPCLKIARDIGKESTTKRRKMAATSASLNKENLAPGTLNISSYPLSDIQLNYLKKTATAVSSSSSSPSASTSKTKEGKLLIDGERISFANKDEWIERGLKTPKTKILKSLFQESQIDMKSVTMNLVRMQLVEEGGMEWQQEMPTKNHIGTLFVVLPVKHKGGKITVRCADESWSIDPAKRKSTERCSWIAFTSDAEFNVESVKSGTQVLLVYHAVGKAKKATGSSKKDIDKDQAVIKKLDEVANQADVLPRRIGVFLENKYNPKDFSVSCLKGKDRWLYNVLNKSKYDVKLTFVRALLCSWGFYDQKSYPRAEKTIQMSDCGDDSLDSEIWEMDLPRLEKWKYFQSAHKCRRLPWEMPWLGSGCLIDALHKMTRVDRDARPSWSEGLTLAETYRTAAILISIQPNFEDTDDGPFSHFYPVAHPDPRGVSEREDFDWGRAKYFVVSADCTDAHMDRISMNYQDAKDWVHEDI